jgi:hypothetical protein
MDKMLKKRLGIAVIVLVCLLCSCAAGETDLLSMIRGAGNILWASEDYVYIDDELIRVSDGKAIQGNLYYFASTGAYIFYGTDEESWLMDKTGKIRPVKMNRNDLFFEVEYGKYGLFVGHVVSSEEQYDGWSCIYNPEKNKFSILSESKVYEVYQDPKGQSYVLTEDCGIYNADGKKILKEGKYTLALNCNYDAITNGYLTADNEEGAVILSPYTGKVESKFPGFLWVNYDDNHDIYRDNTALLGVSEDGSPIGSGTRIIGLDGKILKELSGDQSFSNRGERNEIYSIEDYSRGGYYNVITDRTYWYKTDSSDPYVYITCEETGETFKGEKNEKGAVEFYQSLKTGKDYNEGEIINSGEPIPERYEKYKPVRERLYWPEETDEGIIIVSPEGRRLGDRYWVYFPWERQKEAIEGYSLFEGTSLCACSDLDGLIAVINTKGETVLPAEYEEVKLIGTFSDKPKEDKYNLAAKKDGQWYLFNEEGKPLYPDKEGPSTEQTSPASEQIGSSEADILVFNEQYPGKEADLNRIGGHEKATLFAGPGNQYPIIRKINPNERNTTTAYFIENDMVFVHYVHHSVNAYAYMKRGAVSEDTLTGVPEIEALQYVEKVTKKEAAPLTGPGEDYEKWKGPAIPKGSSVRCYFTSGDYCFVEYEFTMGTARVWIQTDTFGIGDLTPPIYTARCK